MTLLALWLIANPPVAIIIGRALAHAQPQHHARRDLGDVFGFHHGPSSNSQVQQDHA